MVLRIQRAFSRWSVNSNQVRNQLWEVNTDAISNVVAAQVRLLRRQLAAVGCEYLIETIHGTGYRFNVTDEPE